nr:MAG TPA: hypothetical protein [Caudoviricetes sp.]
MALIYYIISQDIPPLRQPRPKLLWTRPAHLLFNRIN